MESFTKLVKAWKPLTIFAKSFILDVRLGSEYTNATFHILVKLSFNKQANDALSY